MKEIEFEAIALRLHDIAEQIEVQNQLIEKAIFFQRVPALCTIEQACALKGGSDYKNVRRRFWLQPCCGTRSKRHNGRKVWPREEVIKWLNVTDETLEKYAESMGVDISRYFKDGKAVRSKN